MREKGRWSDSAARMRLAALDALTSVLGAEERSRITLPDGRLRLAAGEAPEPRDIGLHHGPGAQEIGEQRARASEESPGEAKQEKSGNAIARHEMHNRVGSATGADDEKIGSHEANQRPMEYAGRKIPNRHMLTLMDRHLQLSDFRCFG